MASPRNRDHQVHQICGDEGTSVWTVIYVGDEGHFMQPGPTSLCHSGHDHHHHQISVHICIYMAYGNELILEELVIWCVAIGTVIQDRRIGKEAVGLGAINSSNRCSR